MCRVSEVLAPGKEIKDNLPVCYTEPPESAQEVTCMRLFLRKTGRRVPVVKHTDLSSWLCFAGITRAKLGRPFMCGKRREGKVQICTALGPEGEKARFRYAQH